MTPLHACEPIFQCVGRLNRAARQEVRLEINRSRAELLQLLDQLEQLAAKDPALREQFDPAGKGKLLLVMTFFIDGMISELPWVSKWPSIAKERYKELGGDDRFFDLLNETLAERGESADQRLAVYYTCLGLGFTGAYAGQHEYLRNKMLEIYARLKKDLILSNRECICPDAYYAAPGLPAPTGYRLLGIGIALIGLVIVLFVANIYLYRSASDEMREALKSINKPANQAGTAGGTGSE